MTKPDTEDAAKTPLAVPISEISFALNDIGGQRLRGGIQ